MATGDISGSSIYIEPQLRSVGKVYAQNPTDASADLTYTGNTAKDEIDSLGNSTEVVANMPRYDFRKEYVVPTDGSYYSFDGTNDYVTLSNPTVSAVTNPFSAIIKLKTGSDITTEQGIYNNILDGNNNLTLGIRFGNLGFMTNDGATYDKVGYALAVNTEYTIAITKPNTHTGLKKIYINGVLVTSIIPANIGAASINQKIGAATASSLFFLGYVYTVETYNLELSASEVLDRYNGVAITDAYKQVTNDNKVTNGTFTGATDWNVTGESTAGTGVGRIYSSVGAASTLYQSGSLIDGTIYRLDYDITGTSSGQVIIGNAVVLGSIETGLTGSKTLTFTAGSETDLVFKRGGVCDTSIDNIVLTKLGNTLNLSTGKTASTWYDLDHDAISTVTGATLTASNGFGANAHTLNTCPALLLEPAFTNYYLNSATPIASQPITTLTVGVEYTVSCKGVGIITIDEAGGAGIGGTATEVNPFTYTATQTSVTILTSNSATLDYIQVSNTDKAYNHVATTGSAQIKAQDVSYIPLAITTWDFTTEDFTFVFDVEFRDLSNSPMLYCKGEAAVSGWYFQINSGGSISVYSGVPTAASSTNNSVIAIDTNYKIVVTRSGTSVKIYVGGVDVTAGSGVHTTVVSASAKNMYLGAYDTVATYPMDGKFNEFQVYTSELTAAEVAAL